MEVRIRPGYIDPLDLWKPDARIIIDVFRASTTALSIIESGASEAVIANDFKILKKLDQDGWLIISEVFSLGIDNSPTLVRKMDVNGLRVALKTSNLTTALEKNDDPGETYICCFNNLSATAKMINLLNFKKVEIIPAGLMASKQMTTEDLHCAQILKATFEQKTKPKLDLKLLQERISEKCLKTDREKYYIDDLNLAIKLDISNCVLKVIKKQSEIFWFGSVSTSN